ncbi:MAG: hypothetical protein Q9227_003388 [Pyrenula ochraceoflavens]
MALTTTTAEPTPDPIPKYVPKHELPSPPPVVVTPCDPWPRPYYFDSGLRRVAPYHYTYNTNCKERWRNRPLLDIFSSEFRDRPSTYYKNAIINGDIVLNGQKCDPTTIVRNGDVVSHTLHRHEPPVTALPISVIHEDEDMIVIEKPAGVPVHPTGRYGYNSVTEIMRAERGYHFRPLPCHRLDRLTSGVMFIGRNARAAEDFGEKLRGRTVRKEYLARVKGRFPDGDDGQAGGVVMCDQPIMQISPILGLNRARPNGKKAKTLFKRLAYYPPPERRNKEIGTGHVSGSATPTSSNNNIEMNHNINPQDGIQTTSNSDTSTPNSQTPSPHSSNTSTSTTTTTTTDSSSPYSTPAPPSPTSSGYSLVRCLPLTGRTHQLRVHLQYLGHPITNDPIYSNRRVFGADLARHDSSPSHDADIISRLSRMGKDELASTYDDDVAEKSSSNSTTADHSTQSSKQEKEQEKQEQEEEKRQKYLDAYYSEIVTDYKRRKGEKMTGEHCPVCNTELYSDPSAAELGIFLHAVAYSDLEGKWAYRSPMPAWALPPEGCEGPREYTLWEGDEGVEREIFE